LAQQHPEKPDRHDVLKHVAEVYGVNVDDVLDRRHHREAYKIAIFPLRRVCNMHLKEVAMLANISPGRVSQIQKIVSKKGYQHHSKTIKYRVTPILSRQGKCAKRVLTPILPDPYPHKGISIVKMVRPESPE